MSNSTSFNHSTLAEIQELHRQGLSEDEIVERVKTKLNDSLLKRSFGYEVEEVKTFIQKNGNNEVKKIEKKTKHIPADIKAIELTKKIIEELQGNKQTKLF